MQGPLAGRAARLIALALVLGARPPVLRAQTPPDTTIERVTLGPGIYLFRVPSARDMWTATNSVVIVNDDDVTVFDSCTRPSTARLIVGEIRKLTPKPVRVLINSHWHMDHWSGNEVFAREFPGLEIIATVETRDYMRRLSPRFFVESIGAARRRARLDTLIRTGKAADGSPFTEEARREAEANLARVEAFAREMATVTHVLPTVAYRDSLTFYRGPREFRLFSATGDATGSTVLYLPKEKVLVTGDVLVRQEEGNGAQPWTTNSYAIMPWLASLKAMDALDLDVIVPGQGGALHDRTYLRRTIALFEAIIGQVHQVLERGAVSLAEVRQAVHLDAIRAEFTGGDPKLDADFDQVAAVLVNKVYQESHDGVAGRN
jgi:glyoxylase-like metal-dependent hydrolase (beta-lactamase superfamily II)